MKKFSRVFALVLVAVMACSLIPTSAFAASNLDGKKIVCFGDSLTQGTLWWVNNGYDVYPDILADNLSASTVINAGVRGDSTYNAILRYEKDVIAKDPDIVLMCFGMNDQAWEVQYNRPIQTLEKYTSQLTTMINAIKASGADVVLVTPNPVYEAAYSPTAYNNYEYGLMPQYCDAMRKLAYELDCGLVDMNFEITKRGVSSYISSDGIHQSTAGHSLYAECITAYLKAAYDNVNRSVITVDYKTENGNKIASSEYIGAIGAGITVPVPDIEGHTAVSAAVETAFAAGGSTVTLTYKSELENALATAESSVANAYGESMIDEIRALCANGRKMLSPDNTAYTPADMAGAAKLILNALDAKGENTFIKSLGASYTTTEPNYFFNGSDTRYCDDGKRLTDGAKSAESGENTGGYNYYSAWSSTASIVLDLGEKTETNTYRAYVAGCSSWGITAPSTISVEYSDDGNSFSKAESTVSRSSVASKTWNTYVITAESKNEISARYIKITIPGGFVWVDEVEASLKVAPIENVAYINGFNSVIGDSDSMIFTSEYGNLDSANLRYTANLVAKWNEPQNAYIVSEVFEGDGNAVDRILSDDEILIAVHYGTSVSESGSAYGFILGAEKGQKLVFNGVDTDNKTVDVLAYVSLAEGEVEPEIDYDVNSDGNINMFDYITIKSICLERIETNDELLARADVTGDGRVNMFDYIAVKNNILN